MEDFQNWHFKFGIKFFKNQRNIDFINNLKIYANFEFGIFGICNFYFGMLAHAIFEIGIKLGKIDYI